MIDYEFRILSEVSKYIIKNKLKSEPVMIKKISKSIFTDIYLHQQYKNYFKKLKKINQIIIRGLPINNKKLYLKQELMMDYEIKKIKIYNDKIKFKKVMQLPNPYKVNFREFISLRKRLKNVFAYELISYWYNLPFLDTKFNKFFEFLNNNKLILSLEIEYFSRDQFNLVDEFFILSKKYPNIKFMLTNLGAGIFLHWRDLMAILNSKPILISSTPKSFEWFKILKLNEFKQIPFCLGTDIPFNGNKSFEIYKEYLKNN